MTQLLNSTSSIAALLLLSLFGSFIAGSTAHAAADIGDLVKCADTSAVYYIGDDGKRYVFPNDRIYFSHYKNFDDVKEISCDDLATLKLGGNVTYAPGTRLVKLLSVPTVYALEPGGVLRAIASEEQAAGIWGDSWAELVDDLSDAFFPAYTLGAELGDNEVPEGMIVDKDSIKYRMDENGHAVEMTSIFDGGDAPVLLDFVFPLTRVETYLGEEVTLATPFDDEAVDELRNDLRTVLIDEVSDAFEPLPEVGETIDDPTPQPVTIEMESGNFFFAPNAITAEVGQEITINFANNSGTHTFAIDELGIDEFIVEGESLTFSADLDPGTYSFYCSVGSHRELGMEGTLTVLQ